MQFAIIPFGSLGAQTSAASRITQHVTAIRLAMARSLASRAPMAVFSAIIVGAGYAVYYAHHQQRTEKQTMRAGVIRDIKRDRLKQRELHAQQQQQQQQEGATSSSGSGVAQ